MPNWSFAYKVTDQVIASLALKKMNLGSLEEPSELIQKPLHLLPGKKESLWSHWYASYVHHLKSHNKLCFNFEQEGYRGTGAGGAGGGDDTTSKRNPQKQNTQHRLSVKLSTVLCLT